MTSDYIPVLHMARVARRLGFTADDVRAVRLTTISVLQDSVVWALRGSNRHIYFATSRERNFWLNRPSVAVLCDACCESAHECSCAVSSDGSLYAHRCSVCDSTCPDGEDCCEPESEEPSEPEDCFVRERSLRKGGDRAPFAPYYVGVEFETDSLFSRSEVDEIDRDTERWLGVWGDGTIDGVEAVTQPLRGSALLAAVKRIARFDVSIDGHAKDKQCGLHMHVDCSESSAATRAEVVRLWAAMEPAFRMAWEQEGRADGGYCMPLSKDDVNYVLHQAYGGFPDTDAPLRYRGLNIRAYEEHRTLEFRLWGWPPGCAGWSAKQREAHIWKCVRWTQAFRLAGKLIADSGLRDKHPIYSLVRWEALELIKDLIPLPEGI